MHNQKCKIGFLVSLALLFVSLFPGGGTTPRTLHIGRVDTGKTASHICARLPMTRRPRRCVGDAYDTITSRLIPSTLQHANMPNPSAHQQHSFSRLRPDCQTPQRCRELRLSTVGDSVMAF